MQPAYLGLTHTGANHTVTTQTAINRTSCKMIKLYAESPKASAKIGLSPGQKVARKYRREYLRKIRRREYRRLRKTIPAIADKKVDKVTVIEEAIKYIDHLHEALAQRLLNMGVPAETLTQENMFEMIRHLAPPHLTRPFDFQDQNKTEKSGNSTLQHRQHHHHHQQQHPTSLAYQKPS